MMMLELEYFFLCSERKERKQAVIVGAGYQYLGAGELQLC